MAPLTKALVESEDPLCGDIQTGHEVFGQAGYCQIWCEDADVETIGDLPSAVVSELQNAAESFDEVRMASVIRLKRRQLLEAYERKPSM